MSLHRLVILLPALVAAGCAAADESAPPPGAGADFTERTETRAADAQAVEVRKADARADARADLAVDRMAESARERRKAD